MIRRRGFLKLVGQAAAVAIGSRFLPDAIAYSELDVDVLNYPDWVRDMGSYWQVLVPPGKSVGRIALDKPVLLGMGAHSSMQSMEIINGVLNLFGEHFRLDGVLVDTGNVVMPNRYCAVEIMSGTYYANLGNLNIRVNKGSLGGLLMPANPTNAVSFMEAQNFDLTTRSVDGLRLCAK